MTCCVCLAIVKATGTGALPTANIALYGGSSYCQAHLCHVDEAVGEIRRLKENSNRAPERTS